MAEPIVSLALFVLLQVLEITGAPKEIRIPDPQIRSQQVGRSGGTQTCEEIAISSRVCPTTSPSTFILARLVRCFNLLQKHQLFANRWLDDKQKYYPRTPTKISSSLPPRHDTQFAIDSLFSFR